MHVRPSLEDNFVPSTHNTLVRLCVGVYSDEMCMLLTRVLALFDDMHYQDVGIKFYCWVYGLVALIGRPHFETCGGHG
jgi:hypothetical protein